MFHQYWSVVVLNSAAIILLPTLIGACADPKERDPDLAEQAPDPIGPELMRVEGAWSSCSSGAHLYRQGREIQSQCFDAHGKFVYDNRGTLTHEASTVLDAELAAADLGDTEPVNHLGSCGVPDANGIETLWIGDESISFEASCLIEGIVPLYEHVVAVWTELTYCGMGTPELLVSIEPGCRSY